MITIIDLEQIVETKWSTRNKERYESLGYEYTGIRGMKYNLEIVQKRDSIKTKYCKDNNIKLIRIPYWDFKNIDTILTKELIEKCS